MPDEITPETAVTESVAPATPTEPVSPAAPAEPTAATGTDPAEPATVEQLPSWAQRELKKARDDAAKYRTEKQSLVDEWAVKLGLKTEEKADPAVLSQQLTTAQQASKDAALQLAIYRAAPKQQADPDRLLDSNTFLASVQSLDPTSSDFPTQVSDAIKTAVTSNTSLRLVQATGSSAADHAGGSGEHGAITEQQLASMTPEQKAAAFTAGRLNHLL